MFILFCNRLITVIFLSKMKFIKKNNLLLIIVDVSASNEAFVGSVCLIAVRHSVSGRTGCLRCGRVDKTPRLCSSTCLAPSRYVSPPWSICPLCYLLCRWPWHDPNLWRGWERLHDLSRLYFNEFLNIYYQETLCVADPEGQRAMPPAKNPWHSWHTL